MFMYRRLGYFVHVQHFFCVSGRNIKSSTCFFKVKRMMYPPPPGCEHALVYSHAYFLDGTLTRPDERTGNALLRPGAGDGTVGEGTSLVRLVTLVPRRLE